MCLVPSVRGPVSTGKTLMAMACEKASKLLRTPETTDRRWEAGKGMVVVNYIIGLGSAHDKSVAEPRELAGCSIRDPSLYEPQS